MAEHPLNILLKYTLLLLLRVNPSDSMLATASFKKLHWRTTLSFCPTKHPSHVYIKLVYVCTHGNRTKQALGLLPIQHISYQIELTFHAADNPCVVDLL